MPKATVACDYCGEPIEKQPCHIKRVKHNFCNQKCYGAWRSENIQGADNPNWQGGPPAALCDFCGKPIKLRCTALLEFYEHHFCNLKCLGAWRSENLIGENGPGWRGGPLTVTCDFCGKPIEKPARYVGINNHHFCNRECSASWQSANLSGDNSPAWKGGKITVQCNWCGAQLERYPCLVTSHNFCNRECRGAWQSEHWTGTQHPNWQGGYEPYYGPNWYEQQHRARDRDRDCQRCGKTPEENGQELDVHHIVPFRTFNYIPDENENYLQANDLNNLQCLCHECHPIVESESNNQGKSR